MFLKVHNLKYHQVNGSQDKWQSMKEIMNCEKCGAQVTRRGYVNHYKRIHGCIPPGTGKKYICDQCSEEYGCLANLKKHVKEAHQSGFLNPKSTFECKECQKEFKGRQFYITHFKQKHKSLPPEYKDKPKVFCDQCPDVFLSDERLRQHVSLKHTKKKVEKQKRIFSCDQCEKTYSTQQNLKEHRLVVHQKLTPYKCDLCPRKFGLKAILETHIYSVHSKVSCDLCNNQKTYNNFELKRHKAEAHGIIPSDVVQCSQCPLIFKNKANLKLHIAKKHDI